MKTSELLRKAADEIRRRGWHQGDYEAEDGSVCAFGALSVALTGDPFRGGGFEFNAARTALMRTVGSVITFNDAKGRTVEEVLDAFEKAAQAAELEES